MVWSILFYFCRLFAIFFLSFIFYYYFFFIIYLFITAIYCQVINVYSLINNYWLICFLITLKVHLVYIIISIFYYYWLIYVSLQFLFFSNVFFEYISEVLTISIGTTEHCNIGLVFDCLVFSFATTLRVLKLVMFSYDII